MGRVPFTVHCSLKRSLFTAQLCQGLLEICDQIVEILDAYRKPDQRFSNTHLGAALRSHFPIDGVRDRDREGPVIAQMARRNHELQAVEEIEAVDAVRELEAHE